MILNRGYIPNLDGIRAVAVVLVVISHYGLGHLVPGGFGVTIFFFLSGYLITTLLNAEYESKGKISIKNFFLRRAIRLFPPLIVTLLIAYLLVYLNLLTGEISYSSFFCQLFYFANYNLVFNITSPGPAGTGILWSLAVEEHFYIFFPFVFVLFRKYFGRMFFVRCIFVFITLILIWRCVLFFLFDATHTRLYYSTDTRIDSILFGVLLAVWINPVHDTNAFSNDHNKSNSLIFMLATLILLSTFLVRDSFFREVIRYSLQGGVLIVFFYFAIRFCNNWFFSVLENKIVKLIGVYSYSIYLSHYLFFKLFSQHISEEKIILLLSIFSTLGYSYLINRYIDSYFRRFKHNLR